jgi:transposase
MMRAARGIAVDAGWSVLRWCAWSQAGEGWLASLVARRSIMVAAVAQANKAARIVWARLARGGTYDPQRSAPQPAAASEQSALPAGGRRDRRAREGGGA